MLQHIEPGVSVISRYTFSWKYVDFHSFIALLIIIIIIIISCGIFSISSKDVKAALISRAGQYG